MTVGELRAFLEEADRAGLPDEVPVLVDIGWKRQLTKVEVTASGLDDEPTFSCRS